MRFYFNRAEQSDLVGKGIELEVAVKIDGGDEELMRAWFPRALIKLDDDHYYCVRPAFIIKKEREMALRKKVSSVEIVEYVELVIWSQRSD